MTPTDMPVGGNPRGSSLGPRRVALVLGMHRSGTSVVTEIVCRLGFTAGADEDLIGATPFNPRGHFELRRGVELDNTILQRAAGTWDDPPSAAAIEYLDTALRPPAHEWFGAAPAWTFKDPRLCLTLPIWMRALAGDDVRIVHVMRDPHAVASSLTHRNQTMAIPASRFLQGTMCARDALSLWSEYNRRALLYVEQYALPRLLVWYDQLVDSPEREVMRLAEFLECEPGDTAPIVECVQPALRHAWPLQMAQPISTSEPDRRSRRS